jgi:hypothetical protein
VGCAYDGPVARMKRSAIRELRVRQRMTRQGKTGSPRDRTRSSRITGRKRPSIRATCPDCCTACGPSCAASRKTVVSPQLLATGRRKTWEASNAHRVPSAGGKGAGVRRLSDVHRRRRRAGVAQPSADPRRAVRGRGRRRHLRPHPGDVASRIPGPAGHRRERRRRRRRQRRAAGVARGARWLPDAARHHRHPCAQTVALQDAAL